MRLTLILVILVVLLLGASIWPTFYRYAPTREDILVYVQRVKGLLRKLTPQDWSDIPAPQLKKITGHVGLNAEGTAISGRIHNGSDWVVRELIVRVTVRRKPTRATLWSREFKVPSLYISPSNAQSFSVDVARTEGPAEIEWNILSARGHR